MGPSISTGSLSNAELDGRKTPKPDTQVSANYICPETETGQLPNNILIYVIIGAYAIRSAKEPNLYLALQWAIFIWLKK